MERKTDRILVLEAIPGMNPKDSMGVTDPRLLTGENKLHAKMDTNTCFWGLSYESGVVPESFKLKFTTFQKLLDHVNEYFRTRNIRVAEVID